MRKMRIPQVFTLIRFYVDPIKSQLTTILPKNKKHRQSSDYQCLQPVGVTGFEPATTRPPGANFKLSYFSISLIFRINITECQMVISYEFSSFCWQFRKNVSYLCHSNKSKINETLKELKYGTL